GSGQPRPPARAVDLAGCSSRRRNTRRAIGIISMPMPAWAMTTIRMIAKEAPKSAPGMAQVQPNPARLTPSSEPSPPSRTAGATSRPPPGLPPPPVPFVPPRAVVGPAGVASGDGLVVPDVAAGCGEAVVVGSTGSVGVADGRIGGAVGTG